MLPGVVHPKGETGGRAARGVPQGDPEGAGTSREEGGQEAASSRKAQAARRRVQSWVHPRALQGKAGPRQPPQQPQPVLLWPLVTQLSVRLLRRGLRRLR